MQKLLFGRIRLGAGCRATHTGVEGQAIAVVGDADRPAAIRTGRLRSLTRRHKKYRGGERRTPSTSGDGDVVTLSNEGHAGHRASHAVAHTAIVAAHPAIRGIGGRDGGDTNSSRRNVLSGETAARGASIAARLTRDTAEFPMCSIEQSEARSER